MKWISRWKRPTIAPAWEFKTNGILWRLLPSVDGLFVGEDRDVDAKSVSLFCLDQRTGAVQWKDVQLKERWWISLEIVHENVVLACEFATPDMPDFKTIHALDLSTGKPLWQNDEARLLFAHGDCVYACKETYETRIFFEIDLNSGTMLRELDAQYIEVLRETIAANHAESMEFPVTLDLSSIEDSRLRQEIGKVTNRARVIGPAECIDKGDVLVLAYYNDISTNPLQQVLRQELFLVDKGKARSMYRDVISSNSIKAVPDAFFSRENFIYYIKDKRILRAIDLSGKA